MRVAFITGITGQDGSYLAELLLEKGYHVHGLIRRASNLNTHRIEHLYYNPHLKLHYGDMTDGASLYKVLNDIRTLYPDMDRLEIYNLAAQSHVKVSFEMPEYTADTDGFGTLKILEAILNNGLKDVARFYQASTSELYGKVQEVPQRETTPFYPRSPYGVAKLYAYWIVRNYREAYGIFACNGILFNHGGPRRGHNFVERKITMGVGKILRGELDCLVMGNLDSQRDIGSSRDYVEGMWRMLQQDIADDFVLATGQMWTVRELIEKAFAMRGIVVKWKGEGVEEVGYDMAQPTKVLVKVDEKYFRPAEVDLLLGDASKAERVLGWRATTTIDELLGEMLDVDAPIASE